MNDQIQRGLNQSVIEEREAAEAYQKRGQQAKASDPKTAGLYEHIRGEELQHREEFEKRKKELGGLSWREDLPTLVQEASLRKAYRIMGQELTEENLPRNKREYRDALFDKWGQVRAIRYRR